MNYLKTAILLAGLTALFMGVGYLIGGRAGTMIALVVAAAMNLFAYWNADKMVLVDERRTGGGRAHRAGIRRTGAAARRSAPACRRRASIIMDNPQPNAFATGRNPQNAAVAATTGLLQHAVARGDRRRDGA